MPRAYTEQNNPVSYEIKQKHRRISNRFTLITLSLLAFVAVIYYISKAPEDYLDDPSDQCAIRVSPKVYTRLEGIDPEERDVFQGFQTSFLPAEEIIHARRRRHARGKRNNEDNMQDEAKKQIIFHQYNDSSTDHVSSHDWTYSYDDHNQNYEDNDTADYNDDDFRRVLRPDPPVDRGPLDDVVEQIRGQPELEEGEIGSTSYVYKSGKSFTGVHAFWKGQGDRDTIKSTQASIMKKYMDAEADPCHDFYQYACGNWASLNPIPADKAGYDTFEMLRENLDKVLKDLLEFNEFDVPSSVYPGEHLQLDDNFLKKMKKHTHPDFDPFEFDDDSDSIEDLFRNSPKIENHSDPYNYTDSKSEIISRIHRYLNRKSRQIKQYSSKQFQRVKSKLHGHKYNYEETNDINNDISNGSPKLSQKQNKRHQNRFGRKLLTVTKSKKRKQLNKRQERSSYSVLEDKKDDNKLKQLNKRQERPSYSVLEDKKDDNKLDYDANVDATLKARYLFKSCMNYEILSKRKHQPLLDLLDLFGGWPILDPDWDSSEFDWLELIAKLRLYNNDILISEWVGPDIKNSDEFVIQFDQTSLGLPTRDYFLQESNKVYLNAYKAYLIKIGMHLGGDPHHVRASADQMIQFEINLAKITSAPEDRRNVSELYRRMTLRKLEKLVPEIKWRKYLCIVMNRTVAPDETVVLFALSYVKHLVKLIDETEPNVLANYLLWRFVRHRVNNLDDRFQSAKQQFYYLLFGREEAPPRWKNCISQVNSNMGMALGSMFVKKYFDETSKNDTLTMTREIQQSFKELLHMTDWIDDNTKKLAAHKVEAMMLRIGYPDFILNKQELDNRYKEVTIHPDKYFENILNILQHLTKMEQIRLGQPVNKTLWNTAPAVVNAYYSRNKNQIMFPAGILQPPFYHRHFPRSLNYGGIGVVIGHEITHGFDDKGRLFDCDGNLHRWWSDSAIEAFHKRAQCLIDQYGHYVVPEVNVKLDGVYTQGENIADNGGVKQAFRAYLHWVQRNGAEGETLPGLNHTHTQLFFLNFAQVWCGAMRPEAMRNKLKTAVHSPGKFRVIGTLSNSHDFAREFKCPLGSPMNPKKKCSVW